MDLGILIDANSTEKNFLNQKYLAREILKWVPDIGQVWINEIVDNLLYFYYTILIINAIFAN